MTLIGATAPYPAGMQGLLISRRTLVATTALTAGVAAAGCSVE